jgi:response regulator RpfG family c-di-GMP phosphodiesterase
MKKVLITNSLLPEMAMGGDVLSREEIKILSALSGNDIIAIHREEKVDLIMVDLDMTDADTQELCLAIRNDKALKRVSILIVCDDSKPAIASAHVCRANAFLTRPLKSEELFRNVRKLLHVAERRHLRSALYTLVKGQSADNFFLADSQDISSSGILFETDELLKKGDNLKCTFFVGSDPVTARGRVVRMGESDPGRFFYGIQFSEIGAIARNTIENYVGKSLNHFVPGI